MMNEAKRKELLSRWRGIEEEEENNSDIDTNPSKRRRFNQLKEQWFADAFSFLISLPKDNHIWCGSWDIMGPLLETFYNYFKDERLDSPLKILWKRITEEMKLCVQCVLQHHQAQEMYTAEFELSSIGPLLDVLRNLDEERVVQHLRVINARIACGNYIPERDNAEVICVMYEVLMFPGLLDDQSLFTEFENFIEAIDNVHELALGGHQQFPGVYALFFFKRRVRSVGYRLAGCMGKLREATDLEPLQPLLNKFIDFLETDGFSSALEVSRPRVKLERVSVWIGIKSLIGFLEPPAFEEGILERYPIFLDIVLNHISCDSPEFSHAISCLRLLYEMLGCKLWLRSTLSPSVMRNTLVGQCFHTRSEKSHKEIFDLFLPFLQSLEALQDGEHEKQRMHFIYFLLHQVPVSTNFSVLTRKKACQIALLIVYRGYQMNPPCPPFECAHMWGPTLVSTLKDLSLHNSLRQPAVNLIQTILVADAAALVTLMLNLCKSFSTHKNTFFDSSIDGDDVLMSTFHVEEKDGSSWSDFNAQGEITSSVYKEWMCIPMIWIDALVDIDPVVLPMSFSKAVFWARSRFPMVEPENKPDQALPVKTWLSSTSKELSSSFGWKIPTGSDDGGEGKELKNSVKISVMCLPLVRTLNRLTAHFLVKVWQGELKRQWTWETRMGEILILFLVDPDDDVRQIGKSLLEQVSSTRGLISGLKFLCSSGSSLFALFMGLKHALKLVQMESVLGNFQTLQHLFFVLRRVLQEGNSSNFPESSSDQSNIIMLSSDGGFLRQPVFDLSPPVKPSMLDSGLWEKFCLFVSEIAWPSIRKCLTEGKAYIDNSSCQMTCVRLLEILPVVLEMLYPAFTKLSGNAQKMVEDVADFRWLIDLMDWGKSKHKVITAYWKRTVTSLLKLIGISWVETTLSTIKAIESLISYENIAMDELTEKASFLSLSLSEETSRNVGKRNSSNEALHKEVPYPESKLSSSYSPESDLHGQNSLASANKVKENVVVLSDDETEQGFTPHKVAQSNTEFNQHTFEGSLVSSERDIRSCVVGENSNTTDSAKDNGESIRQRNSTGVPRVASKKQAPVASKANLIPSFSKASVDSKDKVIAKPDVIDSTLSKHREGLESYSAETVSGKAKNQEHINLASIDNAVLKELVHNTEDDPLDHALKMARCEEPSLQKPSTSAPKRQVIQLKSPARNRHGSLHRAEAGVRRFKPPRLDDWYRCILEIDYFAIVGLSSNSKIEGRTISKLKEIPVSFQSPEQYVAIFRPLVLEEFKAQLQSSFLEMASWEEMYYGTLSVMSVERIDDFHLIRFVHEVNDTTSSKIFAENDLVLITKEHPENSSQDVYMVGKVEVRERDNKRRMMILLIRFYFQNGSKRLNQARRHIIDRSKWHASRIMSITPQLREFQALSALTAIPLLPVILRPVKDPSKDNEPKGVELGKIPHPLQQALRSSYNHSQLQAISIAMGLSDMKKDIGLSLIQGPPGTGKTRTIVAIVSVLLASPSKKMDARFSMSGQMKQKNIPCTTLNPRMKESAAIARAWQDAALARQLSEDAERKAKPNENSVRGRVLICAQSNAAVDELIARISSEGLYGVDGKIYKPYIVRVGNAKTIHPNSLPYFIDTLVDHRLAEERMGPISGKNGSVVESSMALRSNLEKLVDRIRFYEAKRANLRDESSDFKGSVEEESQKKDKGKQMSDTELEAILRKLYSEKKQIYRELSTAQTQEKRFNEETKALRHKLRNSILKEAEIVVTTLSGCGGDLYGVCSESLRNHKFGIPSEHTLFDAVVIDEAAQALEPATLIPLQLLKSSETKCIMVGDPKQLPATVLSNVASKFLYQCSMFERLQRAGYPVVMLTKQYRMHPEICRFPSMHFYENKLLNGDQMSRKRAPFHETNYFRPYVFYDVVDGKECRGKNSGALSLYNEHEADVAVEILGIFRKRYPAEFGGGKIGIITPYKCQLSLLRSRFSYKFGSSVTEDIEFNTVDGFQGREVDILLLSTVRAAGPSNGEAGTNFSGIGFVADVRRMNVALTRARLALWILGNARTLQRNQNWAALVMDAKERKLVISVKMPYKSIFKAENMLIKNHMENSAPENSENYQRHLKHSEISKDSGHRATLNKKCAKKTKEIKNNMSSNEAQSSRGIDFSSNRINTKDGSSTRGNANSKGSCDNWMSEHMNCAIATPPTMATGNHGKDSKDKSYIGYSEPPRLHGWKHPIKSSSYGKHPKHVEGPSTSDQCRDEGRGRSSNSVASTQVGTDKDVNTKRKQREAVDAILHSALLPAKKSDSSRKHTTGKRPHTPTSAAVCKDNKPCKKRKG